jgi:hypothetical protein
MEKKFFFLLSQSKNVKNVEDEIFVQFNIEQLVIFLSNYIHAPRSSCIAPSMSNIFFVAKCGLKIILFYLRKIFHTPPHGISYQNGLLVANVSEPPDSAGGEGFLNT